MINKYVNNINKILNNNNKVSTGFNVKSGDALHIINERIPEDTEIVSFFVNNIPMTK